MYKWIFNIATFLIIFFNIIPDGCILTFLSFLILIVAFNSMFDILLTNNKNTIEVDILNSTKIIPIEIIYIIIGLLFIFTLIFFIKFFLDMKKKLNNRDFVFFIIFVIFKFGFIFSFRNNMTTDDIISTCIGEIIIVIIASNLRIFKEKIRSR